MKRNMYNTCTREERRIAHIHIYIYIYIHTWTSIITDSNVSCLASEAVMSRTTNPSWVTCLTSFISCLISVPLFKKNFRSLSAEWFLNFWKFNKDGTQQTTRVFAEWAPACIHVWVSTCSPLRIPNSLMPCNSLQRNAIHCKTL